MKNLFLYISAIMMMVTLGACEKVVNVSVDEGKHLAYIDAWITDQPGVQSIKFLEAVNYLDSKPPTAVANAQMKLTDLSSGSSYDFTYNNGAYIYDAGTGRVGFTGHRYKLSITWNGQQYEAYDTLKRNTVIDSIRVEDKDASGGRKAGKYATFYATDIPGGTDYYWIRTYKNGSLNRYVGEMFSIDGGYTEGLSDGFEFLPPFREGITSYDKPYEKGDEVKVVVRSVSWSSYDFGNRAANQIANQGMFATVLENVPANVKSLQPNATKIYGWFGTVGEVSMSKKIQ